MFIKINYIGNSIKFDAPLWCDYLVFLFIFSPFVTKHKKTLPESLQIRPFILRDILFIIKATLINYHKLWRYLN
ncbi:hypothetical protein MNBD_GAMMA05-1139 [hydrothermal vent metagenome]|uniref:Uncharacterized protein n=1 Tax=hydrothermal vent metagenome TaxID=652676 RepID=A0A3B0WRA3_9ZZZZ